MTLEMRWSGSAPVKAGAVQFQPIKSVLVFRIEQHDTHLHVINGLTYDRTRKMGPKAIKNRDGAEVLRNRNFINVSSATASI